MIKTIKYFDTFTGIGGFTKAIQTILPNAQCVGYSEIDKYASQIYEKHYSNHQNYGDITKIDTADLPDFDLLVGGFPCQAFSVAGKRRGFDDTRGTLFFELARILKDKRPRHFIFENVKGLLSHDGGKTFSTILEVLTDLGYGHQWQVLNSKDFGVPQNRERIYIVGHLRGECRPKVFPFIGANTTTLKEYTRGQSQGNRIYATDGISVTLASQAGGLGAKTGLYAVTVNYEDKKRQIGLKKVNIANTLTATSYKGVNAASRNVACIDLSTQEAKKSGKVRRLTPTECERLQAFPDGWTEGVSDTQRYKCCGNAVTVNVVKAIISKLYAQN